MLLALLGAILPAARASLLFYEPFAYPVGTKLSKSLAQNGWGLGNSSGTGSPYITNTAALTYSGLVTSNGSNGLIINGTPSSNRDVGTTNFPPQSLGAANPTLYLSFLLNVQAPTAVSPARMLVALSRSTTTYPNSSMVDGVFIDASNQLWVADGSTAPTSPSTAPIGSGTHLVVARYTWLTAGSSGDDGGSSGGTSQVDLWLDPVTSLGLPETNVPPATITVPASTSSATVNSLYITTVTNDSGAYYLDELRLGTTWADVTPTFSQAVSPTNTTLTVSPGVTNINQPLFITVTEHDNQNNALTNAGFTPVLTTTLGTVGPITSQGAGVFTAAVTSANPGAATINGTVAGTAVGNGAGVGVYFAGPIGTNGIVSPSPGFFPGTYSFNFSGVPGQSFSVWSSTNMALPAALWTRETDVATGNQTMYETTYAGQPSAYSFTVQPPASGPIFYRVSSP
jgi:hypothetical protein